MFWVLLDPDSGLGQRVLHAAVNLAGQRVEGLLRARRGGLAEDRRRQRIERTGVESPASSATRARSSSGVSCGAACGVLQSSAQQRSRRKPPPQAQGDDGSSAASGRGGVAGMTAKLPHLPPLAWE